jgi:hypothetical protein
MTNKETGDDNDDINRILRTVSLFAIICNLRNLRNLPELYILGNTMEFVGIQSNILAKKVHSTSVDAYDNGSSFVRRSSYYIIIYKR